MTRLVERLGGDDMAAALAKNGAMALAIKIAAAGLSFVMFMLLARAMSLDDFGRLGFAFSLAVILSKIGSVGQRIMVLKYAPAYDSDGDLPRLTGVIRYGYVVVTLGCGILGSGAAAFGLLWPGLEDRAHLVVAGVFVLVMGWAEYQAHALRAVAGQFLSQAPRDLFWRLGVIAATLAAIWTGMTPLTATEGVTIVKAVLAATTLGQALVHPRTRPRALLTAPAKLERTEWRRVAVGLWLGATLQVLGPNATVVLVGLMLPPEATGLLFAALRLALLAELVPIAANMVAAPQLSRRWHKRDIPGMQRICTLVSVAAAVPGIGALLFPVLFGEWLLNLFGSGFGEAHLILLVLASAYTLKAVMGPSPLLLQFSGQARAFNRILTVSNVGSMLLVVAATPFLGAMGAALATKAGMLVWTVAGHRHALRAVGVDASAFSIFRRDRP